MCCTSSSHATPTLGIVASTGLRWSWRFGLKPSCKQQGRQHTGCDKQPSSSIGILAEQQQTECCNRKPWCHASKEHAAQH